MQSTYSGMEEKLLWQAADEKAIHQIDNAQSHDIRGPTHLPPPLLLPSSYPHLIHEDIRYSPSWSLRKGKNFNGTPTSKVSFLTAGLAAYSMSEQKNRDRVSFNSWRNIIIFCHYISHFRSNAHTTVQCTFKCTVRTCKNSMTTK